MSSAKQLTPILMAMCLSITSTTIDMAGATTVSVQAFTSNSIDDRTIPPGTTPPTKLPAPLFTYMKQSDTSILKVTYQDAIWSGSPGAPVCEYQLRLDDTSSEPGNRFSAPILVVSGGIYGTKFSSAGVFAGLTAGPHEISIWLSAGSTNVEFRCAQNYGGRTTTIIVEEIEPLIPAANQ